MTKKFEAKYLKISFVKSYIRLNNVELIYNIKDDLKFILWWVLVKYDQSTFIWCVQDWPSFVSVHTLFCKLDVQTLHIKPTIYI